MFEAIPYLTAIVCGNLCIMIKDPEVRICFSPSLNRQRHVLFRITRFIFWKKNTSLVSAYTHVEYRELSWIESIISGGIWDTTISSVTSDDYVDWHYYKSRFVECIYECILQCLALHVTDQHIYAMMTSSNGNIFRVPGPLCGESTGHRWIPLTLASDADLWCFL